MWWWIKLPIDPELAARVPVVLRIENIGTGGGSKYLWTDVRVLKIYKNEPDVQFDEVLSIGRYSFGAGIPGGVCTVYLVPYGDPNLRLWKLHEVDGVTGVSHSLLQSNDDYKDVLGFHWHSEASMESAESNPSGEPTIVFLTIAETETPLGQNGLHPQLLALIDYQRHVNARPRFDGHDVRRSTLNHLAFEIPPESYDAHKQRLEQLELEPTESFFPAMQARALFFEDPERNTLELICHAS